MSDFESGLRRLSERGTPVGAEELIERIEAELAGDPLVVITKRREGVLMTKTDQPVTTKGPGPGRGLAWAIAVFAVILAVGGLYFAFNGGDGQVVDQTTVPTPTTVLEPEPETMTGVEIVEAGVAAVYSGDAERAVELFELSDRPDDLIRDEAAYQAAIGGRLTLDCTQPDTSEEFTCITPYHNAMTDAIGFVDSGDTSSVVVEDGVITEFAFPEHTGLLASIGTFLAIEGRYDVYDQCVFAPYAASCASIQMENLDAWADWHETFQPASLVEFALESWYGGDCPGARHISNLDAAACATASPASASPVNEVIEYESILGAEVSVENCEETGANSEGTIVSCEVHYSNAMNTAVGKPPSVIVKEFDVHADGARVRSGNSTWYDTDYPEDTELLESFRSFAEFGELQDEYEAADCHIRASVRASECANLILDNLDDWAAWHENR